MVNRLSSTVLFPRIYFIGDPPEDPKRPERSKHWTWKIWRTDHLHDKVQRHRLDEERKFRKMYVKFRTCQELRDEIPARTLDIPRRRKEAVRNSQRHTWRKMGFPRHTDGGTIQRNCSPSIQEHQCSKSWNSEKKRWQRCYTLQDGFIEHRTLRKSSWQKKMSSYWKNVKAQEVNLCCKLQERWSGIWKQIAAMSSEIWSTGEGDVLEKSLYWDELQNCSWRRWWFWRSNSSMQRTHTSSWR